MSEYIQHTSGLREGAETINGVAFKNVISGCQYVPIAENKTNEQLSATGVAGDYLAGILVVPATTSPGGISIKDGGGNAVTIFTGGAASISNLVPFMIPLGIISSSGMWKVTTGGNVSVIAVGLFT